VFDRPTLAADRRLLGQVSQVLHSVGNELDNGRAVARPVRRAVRGLAAALRDALAPAPPPGVAASSDAGRHVPGAAATFRAAP
jgi:hypothetical protein